MTRRMVTPGELLGDGDYVLGEGVYREKKNIYSSILGLLELKENKIRVIPLTGKYVPQVGDFVIGIVHDIEFSNWYVDINSAYSAILNANDYIRDIDPFKTDLSDILGIGEVISAKVKEITPAKKVFITMKEKAKILRKGRILEITPTKIPRVIGKRSSMLNILKKETGCTIVVGRNGRIWLHGDIKAMEIAAKAIKRIDKEAHTTGLTERIKKMIEE